MDRKEKQRKAAERFVRHVVVDTFQQEADEKTIGRLTKEVLKATPQVNEAKSKAT